MLRIHAQKYQMMKWNHLLFHIMLQCLCGGIFPSSGLFALTRQHMDAGTNMNPSLVRGGDPEPGPTEANWGAAGSAARVSFSEEMCDSEQKTEPHSIPHNTTDLLYHLQREHEKELGGVHRWEAQKKCWCWKYCRSLKLGGWACNRLFVRCLYFTLMKHLLKVLNNRRKISNWNEYHFFFNIYFKM